VISSDLIGHYDNLEEILSAKYNYYGFESTIPMPAYLIAIAAGCLSI